MVELSKRFESMQATSVSVGETLYESSGGDLATVLTEALAAGYSTLRVHSPGDGSAWTWGSEVTLDPTAYDHGIRIVCENGVQVEYGGNGWMLTVDTTGNVSEQLLGRTFELHGGYWEATGADPAGMVRQYDAYRQLFYPKVTKGWSNSDGDCQVCRWENVESWCENNFFGGKHQSPDRALQGAITAEGESASDSDNHASHKSMQDNVVDRATVGNIQDAGFVFGGNWVNSVAVGTTCLVGADGGCGIHLRGNQKGMVFLAPEIEDAPADDTDTTYAYRVTAAQTGSGPQVVGGSTDVVDEFVDDQTTERNWHILRDLAEGRVWRREYHAGTTPDYAVQLSDGGFTLERRRDGESSWQALSRLRWDGRLQSLTDGPYDGNGAIEFANTAIYERDDGQVVVEDANGSTTRLTQ